MQAGGHSFSARELAKNCKENDRPVSSVLQFNISQEMQVSHSAAHVFHLKVLKFSYFCLLMTIKLKYLITASLKFSYSWLNSFSYNTCLIIALNSRKLFVDRPVVLITNHHHVCC